MESLPPPAAPTEPPAAPAVPSAARNDRKTRKPYALHKTRYILRAIACLFEIIAFFLIVGLATRSGDGDRAAILVFPGIAILWNAAEFITICVNKKGIHPGAHIALDLIIFGLLVGPGSVLVAGYSYDGLSDYYYDCSGSGPCTRVYRSGRNQGVGLASSIFMLLAGLIHFVLFVLSTISVHRWRMAKRDARYARMQAQYQPQPISVAGGTDPTSAFLITYADGRQVIVPPATYQQYPTQHSQASGYYAPPSGGVPNNHGISVVPLPMNNAPGVGNGAGAGAGGMAPATYTSQSPPHPVQNMSQTQAIGTAGSTNV